MTIKMSLSYFMLEDTTTFFLFKIQHIIPLEHYIQHLNYCVNGIINENPILKEDLNLHNLQEFLIHTVDYTHLKTLNAQQVNIYAVELCEKFDLSNHLKQGKPLSIFAKVVSIVSFVVIALRTIFFE